MFFPVAEYKMARQNNDIECRIVDRILFNTDENKSHHMVVGSWSSSPVDFVETDGLSYVKSARGHMLLQKDDQMFTLNRKKADTIYWECVKKKSKEIRCNARVVTHFGHLKSQRGNHNHGKIVKFEMMNDE